MKHLVDKEFEQKRLAELANSHRESWFEEKNDRGIGCNYVLLKNALLEVAREKNNKIEILPERVTVVGWDHDLLYHSLYYREYHFLNYIAKERGHFKKLILRAYFLYAVFTNDFVGHNSLCIAFKKDKFSESELESILKVPLGLFKNEDGILHSKNLWESWNDPSVEVKFLDYETDEGWEKA